MKSLNARLGCLLLAATALSGCAIIPTSGPMREDVIESAQFKPVSSGPNLPYALVRITPDVARVILSDDTLPHFDGSFLAPKPAHITIGVGDVLNITVFEAAAGGLFIPSDAGARPGNFVNLPAQQVDAKGDINVPYAGSIPVLGLTPQDVQAIIQKRLANRALEPQAVVTLADRRSAPVSVVGEVTTSAHYTIDPGGERVLAALARAGGSRFPTYETIITIQRNGASQSALLSVIASDPQQNIQLYPGDTVVVVHEPRYFIVAGAIGNYSASIGVQNRRIAFGDNTISMADALGISGSLTDTQANPNGVFLYRMVPQAQLAAMNVPITPAMADPVPTILMLNLRDPTGYFIARSFPMHAEDFIYVSNAPSTDLEKFLALIGAFGGPAASANSLRVP